MEKTQNKRGQKLYYYLSRLKEKELSDLHDYFQSPLLGNSPQFARMLLIIRDKVLATERNTIDADLFGSEFFPGQELDEKKIKYIRIRLVQFLDKVMDFASFMDYRSDRNAQDIHLLKAMYKRGWEKHFEKVHAEVETKPAIKEDGEYLMYKLWRELVRYEVIVDGINLSASPNLPEIITCIDQLNTYLKLKFTVIARNDEVTFGKLLGIPVPNQLLEEIKDAPQKQPIENQAYFHCHCIMDGLSVQNYEHADIHFHHLKALHPILTNVDHSDRLNLFNFSNNYCLKRIRLGVHTFRKELTALYDIALRNGILSKKGLLPKGFYKNTVLNMCRIGEVAWADLFVEEWKDRIAGDSENLSYYHNKAQIHLSRNEFDKVIELQYSRISLYEDPLYGLAARVYVCRALWEKGEYQWLLSNLEAMRQYMLRTKHLGKVEKSGYEKFGSYLSKMCHAKMASPNEVQSKLQSILEEMYKKQDHYRMAWTLSALRASLGIEVM